MPFVHTRGCGTLEQINLLLLLTRIEFATSCEAAAGRPILWFSFNRDNRSSFIFIHTAVVESCDCDHPQQRTKLTCSDQALVQLLSGHNRSFCLLRSLLSACQVIAKVARSALIFSQLLVQGTTHEMSVARTSLAPLLLVMRRERALPATREQPKRTPAVLATTCARAIISQPTQNRTGQRHMDWIETTWF